MDRAYKSQVVSSLGEAFEGATTVVVAHYHGLTVAEVTKLRNKMRGLGASFRVTKNSLAKLALANSQYEALADLFTGPTAIAFSSDPVAAAKGMAEYAAGNEKLVILGGAFGLQRIDVAGVKTLATLPSLDELRAKIVGVLSTPATQFVGVLQAPSAQLTRVVAAYAAKDNQ